MTSKKEMARLIAQMADTPETTQWLRERNEAMRRSLRDISLSAVQYDAVGGRSGHGDSTAEKVLKRAETEERIRTNERAIRDRLRLHSDLSLVMAEALTAEERTIIWGSMRSIWHGSGWRGRRDFPELPAFGRRRRGWRSFAGLGMRRKKKKARTPEVSLLFW